MDYPSLRRGVIAIEKRAFGSPSTKVSYFTLYIERESERKCQTIYIYIYIYVCVCVCVCLDCTDIGSMALGDGQFFG